MPVNSVNSLVDEFYREFAGLPNGRAIVRNNTPEDAFTLAILKVMYESDLGYEISPENIDKISKIVVAPPDSGIDLFVEIEDGDEYYYDVIQAKYSELTEEEVRSCFLGMEDSIKRFIRNPGNVQTSLRDVISESNFSESFKKNCTYYVYHTGSLNYGKDFKSNEKIITISEMEVILKSLGREDHALKVPYAEFTSDMFNNYILYENASEQAMLCNIRGYDLATLCNKYMSSSMGRNILFGQNLRDSLDQKKSKTFAAMMETIKKEPERFWNYNNGITILCEELDAHRKGRTGSVDLIEISNFSIINGAQTTNALGTFLRSASSEDIEQLKKVYVLVRIMEVNDETLGGNISIYNNLQNPITSRDMVANNYEQKSLQRTLMTGDAPNIFVEIRRGQKVPSQPRFEKHQRTTNEDLAQVAFSAFLKDPFTAKDKKKSLFNKDASDSSYIVNSYYDEVFYLSEENDRKGKLFQKSKEEIDEALFIRYLYLQARRKMKKQYDAQIANYNQRMDIADEAGKERNQKLIILAQRYKEISNTCMFYCIALYFVLKDTYGEIGDKYTFDYFEFYRNNRNSNYKEDIINYFAESFLMPTVNIIKKLFEAAGSMNMTNWIRKRESKEEFLDSLYDEIAANPSYEEKYKLFVERFAIRG